MYDRHISMSMNEDLHHLASSSHTCFYKEYPQSGKGKGFKIKELTQMGP